MRSIHNFAVAFLFYFYNNFVTHIPLYSVRHAYLSVVFGIRIGAGTAVHMGCFITGRRISIGDHSVVNRRCYLDGRGGLTIGANVNISPESYLLTFTHDLGDPQFGTIGGEVIIGDHAWLGARAMVMPGVNLGEGCVVGAGAVVTKNIDPYTIVAGVPARKVGERCKEIRYSTRWFPFFDTDLPR
jgi:acetyltransferase-like isoleucine patch superfamily enzyme